MRHTGDKVVIVVDDDVKVRSFVSASLEHHGYKAIECADAAEARRAASQEEPDHVITDLILTDGKGAELAQWLRGRNPRLKITFISGYDERSVRDQNWIREKDAFLAKPFGVNDLMNALDGEPQPA